MKKMRFCPFCGSEALESGRFCSHCGQEIVKMKSDGVVADIIVSPASMQNSECEIESIHSENPKVDKQKVKIVTVALLAIIFFIIIIAAITGSGDGGSSGKSSIVGSWTTDDGGPHFVEMTFNSDGTFQGEYVLIMMSGSKSSHTWHGTWEVTDQNVLNIDCGNKHFTKYWTDGPSIEDEDTWNISHGELTYDGKTFHK